MLENRFPDNLQETLVNEIKDSNEKKVNLLGFISNNEEIRKINLVRGNLLEILRDNPFCRRAKDFFSKIV